MLKKSRYICEASKLQNTIRWLQQGDAIRWNDGMAEYSQRGMPCCMKQKSRKNEIAMKLENDLSLPGKSKFKEG